MNELCNVSVNELISNRDLFLDFIYTPIEKVEGYLMERDSDSELGLYIDKKLNNVGVPSIVSDRKIAFLSRSLITPNFETHHFLGIVQENTNLKPLFWEYSDDEFRPNVNKTKYFIAKLYFYSGIDRKGGDRVRGINILDFNVSNSKKLSEVNTLWGQSLVDFHHELTLRTMPDIIRNGELFFDATTWYHSSGGGVDVYYKNLLILFLKHGVLFENFLLNDTEEHSFIKNIFLPAFIQVYKETGFKPLICMLTKKEDESKDYWMYYPIEYLKLIKEKFNLL